MGHNTKEITGQNFDEIISNNDVVILDFWAEWCGPCKYFAPIFEAASLKHRDVVFGKINTELEQELSASFNIRSIPTIMVLREKVVLFSQSGALPAEALDELVAKVKGLDMKKIKEEIDQQSKA